MRAIGITLVSLAALSLVVLATAAPARAVEHDHLKVVDRICQTGVPPQEIAGHEEYAAASAREGKVTENWVVGFPAGYFRRLQIISTTTSPHGTTTNFWGPKPLERAYADCIQAR